MRHPFIKLFVIGFAIAVLLAFNYRQFASENDAMVAECNVKTGQCDSISGLSLGFSGPIKANVPLPLTLTLPEGSKQPVSKLKATLTGQDMYMGITEAILLQQGNRYVGEIRIPVCTTETMDWRLAISVADGSDVEPLIYHFSMTQP
ncbi:hypothetical protein [Marinomonas atlantica]|uniref:hypothetical protein n=1 Tax=Marinomonas atlantica TaxID=1806668 RepID=UPI0008376DAE|nr:hypothetical protein [Marinomonas atlantica]MCO4784986.1 hypothetical protein [Marinomonas atlantica]